MQIFEAIKEYEELVFINDSDIGLKAIICIHDTTLGAALGGCRLFNYQSEDDAITDVLRLAKGMTYKSSAAGLNLGGGKCVLMADPKKINKETVFRALGKFVEGLNGRYITAEDVNTTPEDMHYVSLSTKNVVGLMGKSGDPSIYTARGAFCGMKASIKEKLGADSFKGVRVALQGLGHVGFHLVEMLTKDGAIVTVADVNQERCDQASKKFGVTVVDPNNIISTDCDVFSPNAMGGIINDKAIEQLKAKIIAGAANNQLEKEEHGNMLVEKGILYAPDYIINAGGVINVTRELEDVTEENIVNKVNSIYNTTLEVFKIAKEQGVSTHVAANKLAENRIKEVKKLDKIYTQNPKVTYSKKA